jgi:glucose-1-phosphate cytidylyltransferase
MKTIILCGGMGTRLKEETEFKPKPLVLVGGKPMLWHIMKLYAHHGYNEFVLALGYKGHMIKEYFLNQRASQNDFTIDTATNELRFHGNGADHFKITFVETGLESHVGERILRCQPYITEDEFMLTYGDGVSDLDIKALVDFHRKNGRIGTVSGVHPQSKYGLLKVNDQNLVERFDQKLMMQDYVNGGFMVFHKKAFEYFDNGDEANGLAKLAEHRQLSMYSHEGFWKAMDTYKDMEELNQMWARGPKWKTWQE